jgi:hypothetical protein
VPRPQVGQTQLVAERLDWEKANKRDTVRKQGSVRADLELRRMESRQPHPTKTKEGRALLKQMQPLYRPHLDEFARFAPDVQVAYLTRYMQRLKDVTKSARENAALKERGSLGPVFTAAGQKAQAELEKSAAAARKKLKAEHKLKLARTSERKVLLPKANGGTGLRQIAIRVKRVEGGVKVSWPEVKEADAWLVAFTQDGRVTRRTLPRKSRSLAHTTLKPGIAAQVAVHARKGKASIGRGTGTITV